MSSSSSESSSSEEAPSSPPRQDPSSSTRTYQLAITLPSASPFSTRCHLHLTLYSHAIVLFLAGGPGNAATSLPLPDLQPPQNVAGSSEETPGQQQQKTGGAQQQGGPSLQSFVYAMPQGSNGQPISTPLYGHPVTVDLATRIAKVLARKCERPVYVGADGGVAGMETGEDEEMRMVKGVVDVVEKAATGSRNS